MSLLFSWVSSWQSIVCSGSRSEQPGYATCKGEINDFKKFTFDQLNDFSVLNLDINNFITSFLDNFDWFRCNKSAQNPVIN